MVMRIASLVVLTALGRAVAAPAYPVTIPMLTGHQLSQREADFRAANPQHWTEVRVDPHGFVTSAQSDDPKLAAAGLRELADFARRNAGFFHMDPATADRIATLPNGVVEISDTSDGVIKGQIVFGRGPKLASFTLSALFFVDTSAKIAAADVAVRIAGKTYTEVTTYSNPPHLDCAMSHGGGSCKSTVIATARRDVTFAAKDAIVQTVLYREGDAIRLVRCIDQQALAPFPDAQAHGAKQWGRTFVAKAGAPALPLVVDAITGAQLAVTADRCDGLRNFR